MGGFLGIGGSSAKTDRKVTLQGYGDLANVFNYALPTAKNLTSTAGGDLSKASGYFKSILSGNRSSLDAATAPEQNAIRSASDASKRQLAQFGTARGGGVGATNQNRETATQGAIDTELFKARPEAAGAVAKIGSTELNAAINTLGLGEKTAADLTDLSAQSRKTSFDINKQTQQDVTGAIEAALMFAGE